MMSISRVRVSAAGLAMVAAFAAACTDKGTTTTNDQTQMTPVMTTLDDDRIVAAVRSDYFASDQIKASQIDVSSDQGMVTLKGQVPSEDVRQRAVSIAKETDGVTTVNDQLQVRMTAEAAGTPANRSGDTSADGSDRSAGLVTTKILAQYYVNPQLKPWRIDVTTPQDGVVTLDGAIDSDQDRAEAVRIAKSTEGVTDVRDRLRPRDVVATGGTTTRSDSDNGSQTSVGADLSDAWITTKIQARYFIDPDIKGRDINVDTKDGAVVLRGTVGSYSARRQAVSTARNTDGVRDVSDELRVDTGSGGGEGTRASTSALTERIDDGWITTKIQAKFFVDGDLQASGVDITTRNGVVTLSGRVATEDAKASAVKLAEDTDGVRDVRDQLTVSAATNTAQSR